MRLLVSLKTIVALGASALAACGAGGGTTIDVLGKAPSKVELESVEVGPHGRHVVWISKTPNESVVTIDGKPGKSYFFINPTSLHQQGSPSPRNPITYSPDGEHVTYVGVRKVPPGPSGYEFEDTLVIDGRERPPLLRIESVAYSPDSSTLVYSVRTTISGKGQPWGEIVVEGPGGTRKLPATQSWFAFSADSKHFAYYAAGPDVRHPVLMVDDKVFDTDPGDRVLLSPDGKRVAYQKMAPRKPENGMRYACDGIQSDIFDQAWLSAFSPDSAKFVCIGLRRNPSSYSLAVECKEVGAFCAVDLPVFSADSKRMAYRATGLAPYAQPSFAVVDGVKGPDYCQVDAPVFSPDAKRVAYAVRAVSYNTPAPAPFIVLDGKPQSTHDVVFTPVFSPDSMHLAYKIIEKDHRYRILLDETPGPSYERAGDPAFSPDCKHLAYLASRGKETFLVIDGKESDSFERIHTFSLEQNAYFESNKQAHCFDIKDGNLVRVTKDVP